MLFRKIKEKKMYRKFHDIENLKKANFHKK